MTTEREQFKKAVEQLAVELEMEPHTLRAMVNLALQSHKLIVCKAEPVAWAREYQGDVTDEGNMIVVFDEELKDDQPHWFALYRAAEDE